MVSRPFPNGPETFHEMCVPNIEPNLLNHVGVEPYTARATKKIQTPPKRCPIIIFPAHVTGCHAFGALIPKIIYGAVHHFSVNFRTSGLNGKRSSMGRRFFNAPCRRKQCFKECSLCSQFSNCGRLGSAGSSKKAIK